MSEDGLFERQAERKRLAVAARMMTKRAPVLNKAFIG
jgi:hypothetical protein